MSHRALLEKTAQHASAFLDGLPNRHVAVRASVAELRKALDKPLPEAGVDPEQVIADLVRDADPGLLGSTGGRFFGWVIGGVLPAALAADWLTSAWDQNAALYACSPSAAIVEEVCGRWMKDLLGLPPTASFGLVTGCQMAHVTALSAARYELLRRRDWNILDRGAAGAPPLKILTTPQRHESLVRAVRLLGIGSDSIGHVPCGRGSEMSVSGLEGVLARDPRAATIVSLQAGDLNVGTFDPFREVCRVAHAHGAWVHVDGAFGLWVGASETHRHLVDGIELADSWVTDGHKWLNVPFDSGFVFVADAAAHRTSLSTGASYLVSAEGAARDEMDWNPEWSRRGRGFATYAALRSLGRQGIEALVDRCSAIAWDLVSGIGALPGAEVLSEASVNQGLVRFLAPDGDHDTRTDQVIARIQSDGVAWFGGTTWEGRRAMRISVCNWRTGQDDVTRTIESVRRVLAEG